MDRNLHLIVILRLIYAMLISNLEKVKNDIPTELHEVAGNGTILDPHTDVVPQLEPLYELAKMIRNVISSVEGSQK